VNDEQLVVPRFPLLRGIQARIVSTPESDARGWLRSSLRKRETIVLNIVVGKSGF
jgi:hypothetical protein